MKIVDLGVAKQLASLGDLASTIVGTPYYLSPELCEVTGSNIFHPNPQLEVIANCTLLSRPFSSISCITVA